MKTNTRLDIGFIQQTQQWFTVMAIGSGSGCRQQFLNAVLGQPLTPARQARGVNGRLGLNINYQNYLENIMNKGL